MSLEQITHNITEVYHTYDNPILRQKILEFILRELPERLESHIQRMKRHEELEKGADVYINEFLINSGMRYMYIPKSNVFIRYDGEEFKIVNESEILHKILTGISSNKRIIPWKYKIKNMIMKIIRDVDIFDIIPESHTIQYVLNHITPVLLATKEEAKYFLTVLGDNILKKGAYTIHLLDVRCKDFITALEDNIFHYFKHQYHIGTTFKYSWWDHNYTNCRIINFNKSVESQNYWSSFVKYHILDIISVGVYYSKRYTSSDMYVSSIPSSDVVPKHIFYLRSKTEKSIVDDFVKDSIIKVDTKDVSITWKEMYYLWKTFLYRNNLPSVMFMKALKNNLKSILELSEEREEYIGVTSKYLTFIKNLQEFWNMYIVTDDGEEFEVSDICDLYNSWLKNDKKDNCSHMNEKTLTTIIEHFYDVSIVDNKYIRDIKCLLWDKNEEIQVILEDLRITYKFSPESYEKSIDSVYTDYCARSTNKFNYKVVSKKYFEKYISQAIPDRYIIRKRILNDYWST